jgi:predicted N-acetyltransferase YhbS
MAEIRSMREEDLDQVAEVSDQAFIAVIAKLYGQRLERPFFPLAGLALRLWTDPDGCLVYLDHGQVVGALFSVARGTVGWLGPVAVASVAQGQGAGQALVAECLRRWARRKVRMLGLETFPSSGFHAHLYSKFGFRPAWTGVQLRRQLEQAQVRDDSIEPARALQHAHLPLPDLGFLYRGFDPAAEVRATMLRHVGRVFTSDRGLAILHLQDAFHVTPEEAFLPLLVARDQGTFLSLLMAAEAGAQGAGTTSLALRLPGTAWTAFQALVDRGYRAGPAMLRMKAGEHLDYDRDAWYLDDWL